VILHYLHLTLTLTLTSLYAVEIIAVAQLINITYVFSSVADYKSRRAKKL